MAKIAVRRINEWDGPSMLKIYGPYVEQLALEESALPPLSEYIQRIDKYTYGLGWLLCEIDSDPAGFCHLTENADAPGDPFSVDIRLYVKPGYLRRGVGTALYALMPDIMELGNRREVRARILLPNETAVRFHQAMGFSPLRTDKGAAEREGVLRDVLVMQKRLSPADPDAERPIKPYLIENADYEAARERAALLVKPT